MYNLSATNKLQDGGTGNSETSRIFVFFITSHLRLIDSCITQLQAQGPSRTGNESKEEEEEGYYFTSFARPRPLRLLQTTTRNPNP